MSYKLALVIAVILFLPIDAESNITEWAGATAGGPGPVVQSKLELQKEYVLFDEGKVNATFWVHNPTNEKIVITMGFPVKFHGIEADEKHNYISDYTTSFLKSFQVTIGDETITSTYTRGQKEYYPYVYVWNMAFSPHSTVEFTVTYLMYPAHVGRPGAEDSRKFTYITHTGSNWAKPIGEAEFEFCDEGLIEFMRTPPGEYWAQNGMSTYDIQWDVRPTPYSIDRDTSCIEWSRKNWKPVKDVDDILVSYSFTSGTDYASGGVEPCWDGDCSDVKYPAQFNVASILNAWCGKDGKRNQFGDSTSVTRALLTDAEFSDLESTAYSRYDPDFQTYHTLPEHLRTDYQLALLRYLRNYIFARHGHKFKDEQLGKCFSNVLQATSWTDAEKKNMDLIQAKEREITRANVRAWEAVRKKMIKDPGIFGLF